MSGEGMPKRSRADSPHQRTPARPAEVVEVLDSPPTPPSLGADEVVETTPPHDARDPLLEQQLDALDVDEDFRESIRAMTPDTRRDVLNDIIRHQQHAEVEEGLHRLGGPQMFGHPDYVLADGAADGHDGSHDHSDEHDWVNEEGEEEEEEDEDVLDMDRNRHHNGDRAFHYGRAPYLFDRPPMATDEDDMTHPRMHTFGEQDGGPMNILDFFQFVSQHMLGPPEAQGRGPNAGRQQERTALQERMMNLRNLIGMLQQADAMQSMGLDRDVDDMSYEELLELEERIGNVSKGVPPALLESCMTRVEPATPEETCPICQEELSVAAPPANSSNNSNSNTSKACVKLLNCPHVFHKPCIKQWLASNKTCPVCKQEVLPQSANTRT